VTNPLNRVAKAYVEITADYDKFRDEATTKINAALRDVGRNLHTDAVRDKLGDAGREAGQVFSKEFDDTIRNEFRTSARNAVRVISSEANSGGNRSLLRRTFGDIGRFAALALGSGIAGVIGGGSGVGKVFEAFKAGGSILSAVFDSLGSGFGQFLIKAGLGIVIIPHLAGVILVLVANLTSLIGLLNVLPGVTALALGALIPLIIAFQNFGGALQAVMEGDPEKINEALKKLAPSARAVVKEFQGLLPVFRAIQLATQQAFFGPLQGVLSEVISVIGQGRITQGLVNVADAWGKFLAVILRVGESPAWMRLNETIFGNSEQAGAIARALGAIGPPLEHLLEAFANAATTSMPIIEKLVAAFGQAIDNFAEFIQGTVEDGSFNQFLRDALQTTGDLKDLVHELLALFYAIFQATDDGGERFLQKVTKAIHELTEFFQSEDGQRAMEAMVSLAEAFAYFLGLAAKALAGILNLLGKVNEASGGRLGPAALTGTLGALVNYGRQAFAEGGVISRPTFSLMGEAGPEAVVPLNDPTRAAQVMQEAGLVPLAESMGGAGGLIVHVYLGTQEITDILDARVDRKLVSTGRAIFNRPRGVGY
jgi:hypothetical protein